jgi:PAS domain S-box-containing protein
MNIPPRRQPYMMALFVCLGLAAFAGYGLHRERSLATEDTRAQTANVARLLEEHARQSLRRVEMVLLAAEQTVEATDRRIGPGDADLRMQLMALLPLDGLLRGLEVVSAGGAVSHSTLQDLGFQQGDLAVAKRRDLLLYRGADPSRLRIGVPERQADNGWSLPVVLRQPGLNAAFRGTVVALVNAAYFQPLFDSVDTGRNGFVTLFVTQGRIVTTAPGNDALLARDWSDTPLFSEHLRRLSADTVQQVVVRDGTERIYSYRALADYALVVSAGESLTEALADWRASALRQAALLGAVFALMMGAAWAMSRHHVRREAAEVALADSARQTQAIVDNVADGLIMLDERGRIQSLNRAAEGMFGYTTAAVLGQAATELIPALMLPESGAAGAAEAFQGRRTEAQGRRHDGSSFPLEVAVTDGHRTGQALLIALVREVTDRKQAEAELQAQRAALEVMKREL